MNIRKREMCVCPKCDNDITEMKDLEMDIDCLWTAWYCPECEEQWSEYYTLTYDGYAHNGKVYYAEGEECTDI